MKELTESDIFSGTYLFNSNKQVLDGISEEYRPVLQPGTLAQQ